MLPLTRVVCFHTDNDQKVCEARRHFGKYDIHVIQIPTALARTFDESLARQNKEKRYIVMCAFSEQTKLVSERDFAEINPESTVLIGTPVRHVSSLTGKFQNGEEFLFNDYHSGVWCPDNNGLIPAGAFGFDDKVLYPDIGVTMATSVYGKETPRDRNICKIIKTIVHYKAPIVYRWIPIEIKPAKYRCVDMERTYWDVVQTQPLFMSEEMIRTGFANIFIAAANNGTYMRAPLARVHKLIWVVGLAGMPYVPKSECAGQEYIYFSHDSTHMIHPDPMIHGAMTSYEKKLYVCLRLMSEVFTLGTGDMAIVHLLIKGGLKYDTVDRRKLYPAFREVLQATPDFFEDPKYYKKLVYGFFQHTFFGNNNQLLELGMKPDTLAALFNKYDAYLLSDAQWSAKNCWSTYNYTEVYQAWWDRVKNWPSLYANATDMPSIRDIANKFNLYGNDTNDDIAHNAFNYMYDTSFKPLFSGQYILQDSEQRKKTAFVHYVMNQCFVFFRYRTTEWDTYFTMVRRCMDQPYSQELVLNVRGLIDGYIDLLYQRYLITGDDAMNFKEIVPHFPENYIDYDHCDVNKPVYQSVNELLDKCN